jgi:hypothetical protein
MDEPFDNLMRATFAWTISKKCYSSKHSETERDFYPRIFLMAQTAGGAREERQGEKLVADFIFWYELSVTSSIK